MITSSSRSFLLTDLSWVQVEAYLSISRRLIVPLGSCDQFGPHLPIGAATRVVEEVARRLSDEFRVLRAPTLPYGTNLPTGRHFPGPASLGEKTLLRTVNDLISQWEDCGFREMILLTAYSYDPHVEALANVSVGDDARARIVDLMGLDLSSFLDAPALPSHAGEVLTSLLLYLAPEAVDRAAIADFYPYERGSDPPHRLKRHPRGSSGVLGFPSHASAAKGEQILEHMLERLRAGIFRPDEPEE